MQQRQQGPSNPKPSSDAKTNIPASTSTTTIIASNGNGNGNGNPNCAPTTTNNHNSNSNGNNSDNSAGQFSLGNNSFGLFNFESEDGISNPSPPNSDIGGNDQAATGGTSTGAPAAPAAPSVTTTAATNSASVSSGAPPASSVTVTAVAAAANNATASSAAITATGIEAEVSTAPTGVMINIAPGNGGVGNSAHANVNTSSSNSNPSLTLMSSQPQQSQQHQHQHQQPLQSQPQTQQQNLLIASHQSQPQSQPQPQAPKGMSQQQAHHAAAAQTVSKLHSIASQSVAMAEQNDDMNNKRKFSSMSTNSNSGYNPDSEGSSNGDNHSNNTSNNLNNSNSSNANAMQRLLSQHIAQHTETELVQSASLMSQSSVNDDNNNGGGNPKKKKKLDNSKREERNAREKERSYRIAAQINELRTLLSNGGVIVPKGTKNAVLTEAANYIKMLQQHQYKSEIHRQQLIQQMQMIGGGAIGPQAANAIRHVAAQNGVWSLGKFGGVPPRTAVDQQQQQNQEQEQQGGNQNIFLKSIDDHDYRYIFNSCSIPMAIASMGGAFIDCNQVFTELSQYGKQELCSLTIFNLTARSDLQHAFDLVSQMISPAAVSNDGSNAQPPVSPSCVLRGNMKQRNDLGLNITLIRDDEGIAKCFCVSLIQNPESPFDTAMPVHATPSQIMQQHMQGDGRKQQGGNLSSPAFMTG